MPRKPTAAEVGAGNLLGAWAFLIGVILAVIFGFVPIQVWVIWTLVIIGIIIGLLNITATEAQSFLLAGAVLVIVSSLGLGTLAGTGIGAVGGIGFLGRVLTNMLTLFVPATIIVALKAVFTLARR